MTRERLPNRREAEAMPFDWGGKTWTLHVGRFADGRIAEVFIAGQGEVAIWLEAMARDCGIIISIALQNGVPLGEMASAVTRDSKGAPASLAGTMLDRLIQEDVKPNDPAPFDPAGSPGHTDMMVAPEALGEWLGANPLPLRDGRDADA